MDLHGTRAVRLSRTHNLPAARSARGASADPTGHFGRVTERAMSQRKVMVASDGQRPNYIKRTLTWWRRNVRSSAAELSIT
jgi:hypothetical protein